MAVQIVSRTINRTKRELGERILGEALGLLGGNPDRNAKYFIKAINTIASGERGEMVRNWVQKWLGEDQPGREFLGKIAHNIHPNVRRRFLARMFVSLFFRDRSVIERCKQLHGVSPPQCMVISPTMRCNYRCQGCYSASYERHDDMPPETFDRLLHEAEDMGIRFFILVGGEPFIYPDLIPLLSKHGQSFFQIYTNGCFIDKSVARKLVEMGNVAPMISVNGPEMFTDASRVEGSFSKVAEAMDNLREAGGIFGFSTLATRLNADAICTDEWIDFLVEKGALYGWLFLYMPVGRDPDTDLMPTPEQRDHLRTFVRRVRETRPIIPIDFWNDGPLAGSCLAGGRHYFHVNHRGDVEPCIFCHFTTHNVNESSIGEVLASPFFKAIREAQPLSHNTLLPCPIIDHPDTLWNLIQEHGARPTHEGAEKMFTTLAPQIREYGEKVRQKMDDAWDNEDYHVWAPAWARMCGFPPEKLEARRREFEKSRGREH
ncbi:MAG: radical SAM protein [Chloroflexota bacterium]